VKRFIHPAILLFLTVPAALADEDPVLAVVNGHEIHRSYVYEQLEALPLGDQIEIRAQFDRFTDSIVREEVLFQFMIASDFAHQARLREAIKTTVVNHLIERYVTSRINVTDDEIRKYYNDNAGAIRDENVRVSQILLERRSECTSLMATIDSDTSFAAAARAHSLHRESADKGGDIGLYMNHNGPLGFETQFFDIEAGDMRVFESADGCHLVRIMERVTPPMPPLEQVAPRIRTLIERQQQTELLGALIEKASATVGITGKER
jgi:peptidyl-prolyl cis-trans isomerase C